MKKALFYTFLVVFGATALVTLLGVTGVVTIRDGYLNTLFGSLLVELVAGVISLFRGTRFFDEANQDATRYVPSRDAGKILATLWHHQRLHDAEIKSRWTFNIPPQSGEFPRYLRGLSEVSELGLVDMNPANWQICLSSEGVHVCQRLESSLSGYQRYLV